MMSLHKGTFLALSGELSKDKLGNVSGDRKTTVVPRKGPSLNVSTVNRTVWFLEHFLSYQFISKFTENSVKQKLICPFCRWALGPESFKDLPKNTCLVSVRIMLEISLHDSFLFTRWSLCHSEVII